MIGVSAISPIWPKCRLPLGECGGAVLGINPLHALFAAEPLHYSPYSPSSRQWLDYLYIDATAVPGFAEDATVQELVHSQWFGATHWAARSAVLVDYGAVGACKRAVLEPLYRRFREHDLAENGTARTELGRSFRQFQQRGGKSLARFCRVRSAPRTLLQGKARIFVAQLAGAFARPALARSLGFRCRELRAG